MMGVPVVGMGPEALRQRGRRRRSVAVAILVAWVAGLGSNSVIAMNPASGARVATVPVGEGPTGLVMHPGGAFLYCVNRFEGSLSTIATVRTTTIPEPLNHFQQLNSATIQAVPMPGVTLGQALDSLRALAKETLPAGYSVDFGGQSRQYIQESSGFLVTFGFALIIIFLVLAVQFNSFRDPLVILAGSVPLAMFGALVFTVLKMPNPNMPYWTNGWTTTMNIYAQVGLVTLVGLIAKNGILIVEFANQLQLAGKSVHDAVVEASELRLRPILMTTFAMVFGAVPLAWAHGAGAETRQQIGWVIVGGLSVGTFLTLFVIPTVYSYLARRHLPDAEPAPVAPSSAHA